MLLTVFFFVLYILGVVIIGVVTSRRETEEGFMIADRKVSGLQLPATMSAGLFDGATLSMFIAYVYQYGISASWLFVGFAAGFLFLRRYLAHRIKQQADAFGVYSMPEYFYKIFGRQSGLMFSVLLIVQYFFLLAINLIIAGKVLQSTFSLPYTLSVVAGGLIVLSYLLLAGFKAVVKTDFFQLCIMFIMSIAVAGFLVTKTSIPVAEFSPFTIGFGNILGFLLIGAISIVVAPDLWQRIFSAKDQIVLRRGLGYAAIILPLLGAIICIVGLVTKQFFPDIAPEDAFVIGFSKLLPYGLKEFGMVLLYAVALSSSDTITFVVSSIVTRDLINYTQRYSDESMRKLTRFFMIMFVVFATSFGFIYQNIITIGLSLGSLALALFPPIIGSFYWRLDGRAVAWSLGLAALSVLALFFIGALSPQNSVISLPVSAITLFVLQKFFKNSSRYILSV
ncbi:MAG: sodium:solute symporter family protein [Patescibacteria group bacterium]|jgi:SSS family solute:Na+ symporter